MPRNVELQINPYSTVRARAKSKISNWKCINSEVEHGMLAGERLPFFLQKFHLSLY